jgi:hypothetical protein
MSAGCSIAMIGFDRFVYKGEFDELNVQRSNPTCYNELIERPQNGMNTVDDSCAGTGSAPGEGIHVYWIKVAGQTSERGLVDLFECSRR